MTRDEQEMALWRDAYILALSQTWACLKVDEAADAAVAEFRKRYPAEPADDDTIGRAAIEAMDAILGVIGDEDASNQHKAAAIDRIATRYVAARWHIQRETGN